MPACPSSVGARTATAAVEAKTVTFAAGRSQGYKSTIRFCENEFEGDATEVIDALKARFKPVEVRSFPRADVERWLQE